MNVATETLFGWRLMDGKGREKIPMFGCVILMEGKGMEVSHLPPFPSKTHFPFYPKMGLNGGERK